MKKIRFVFPVLLLVCAGMVMMGCPSEAEPEVPGTNGNNSGDNSSDTDDIEPENIVFQGGKYQFLFDDPKIEQDKEYKVYLVLEEYDSAFAGSYLGGKICYKMDLAGNDEKVLSGWLNSAPNSVKKDTTIYEWEFKAGQRNSDSSAVASPATTPAGGKQYFAFTAQDKNWKDYAADVNFNVKAGFKVVAIESVTSWESVGELTLSNEDGTAGKGRLSDEDMAKITANPKGKIEFTVTVTVNDSNAKPGYGVVGVGGGDDDNSKSLAIPGDAAKGALTFKAELKISEIRKVFPNGNIMINPYNGATVTKAELFKPKT